MSGNGDYVLGTEAEEIERLGLQHRVWRERVLDAWRRAGIGPGQTVVDVGAGPGWASADLAEIVGSAGRVIALERSESFLAALRGRGLPNVEVRAQDVSGAPFGDAIADAAWCRWVLSFVEAPERTVAHIARALKPGGVAVFHEYADYGAWRMMPPDPEQERFRTLVVQSWRDARGEPGAAMRLPEWLEAEGLELVDVRPLIETRRTQRFHVAVAGGVHRGRGAPARGARLPIGGGGRAARDGARPGFAGRADGDAPRGRGDRAKALAVAGDGAAAVD